MPAKKRDCFGPFFLVGVEDFTLHKTCAGKKQNPPFDPSQLKVLNPPASTSFYTSANIIFAKIRIMRRGIHLT